MLKNSSTVIRRISRTYGFPDNTASSTLLHHIVQMVVGILDQSPLIAFVALVGTPPENQVFHRTLGAVEPEREQDRQREGCD